MKWSNFILKSGTKERSSSYPLSSNPSKPLLCNSGLLHYNDILIMELPENLKQLETQISANYDSLSNRLKQVAHYALENKSSVAFNTIAVIAEEANVPPSTLIRFAQAFGYKGFNDVKSIFRSGLLNETPNYHERAKLTKKIKIEAQSPATLLREFARLSSQSLHLLSNDISENDINRAVKMLLDANNIFVIGLGRSFSAASYLNYSLSHLNLSTYLVDGLGGMFKEQLDMMREGDILVAISFSPYAQETVITSQVAATKGVKQILLTDHHISFLASLSDVCMVIKEMPVKGAFRTLSATQCLVQTLCVSLIYQGLQSPFIE